MPNDAVDFSVLIVCYRSRDLIGDCLRGIYQYTQGQFEVLLVDCSNDGTVEMVRSDYPQVRVIENSENLGFGRGNNFLAERARGKYLLLLNPDTVVLDDALGELHRTAELFPEAGAVGGRTRLQDGSRDPGCQQFVPTLSRLFIVAVGGAKRLNGALAEGALQPAEVETLSGAFMLVRADAWREVRGFDTNFFMYSEELDLCVRLRHCGWKIVMTPKAEVLHLVGGGNAVSPNRIQYLTTGKMHFLRKFWSRPQVLLGGCLIWMHGLTRVLLGTLGRPLVGAERARKLRQAYSGIVLQPQRWWFGFQAPARRSDQTAPLTPTTASL